MSLIVPGRVGALEIIRSHMNDLTERTIEQTS